MTTSSFKPGIVTFLVLISIVIPLECFKPVIIIPGTGGSQIEAKLDKPSVNHFYCSRTSDWYTLWLSVTQTADYIKFIVQSHH